MERQKQMLRQLSSNKLSYVLNAINTGTTLAPGDLGASPEDSSRANCATKSLKTKDDSQVKDSEVCDLETHSGSENTKYGHKSSSN